MSATDELRRMLDERGVDYSIAPDGFTTWWHDTGEITAWEDSDGVLTVWGITPEQAVNATLGDSRADDFRPIAEITTDNIDLEHGRVTQRWIPERTCQNVDDNKTVWFICSVCGYPQKLSHTRSYCPNCGARRVGE